MPYSKVKFCDLINSADSWLKEGDMLKFYCGIVQHFAIYVGKVESVKGEHCIAHLLGGEGVCIDELSNLPNSLHIKCLIEFTQSGTVHIYRPKSHLTQQIKDRALAQVLGSILESGAKDSLLKNNRVDEAVFLAPDSRIEPGFVGPHKYHLLTNNCEKWARGVYNNNSGTSYQVLLCLPLVNCFLPRKLRI